MKHQYVVINDNHDKVLEIRRAADDFQDFSFVGSAENAEDAIDLILQTRPQLVFLEISPQNNKSNLSLQIISELHRFLTVIPNVIVTSETTKFAFDAIKYGVNDYLLFPFQKMDLAKAFLKFEKKQVLLAPIVSEKPLVVIDNDSAENKNEPLTFCLKSYGDYRYFQSDDVLYLKADNNSTDIFLQSGEKLTAFKTLKHFEQILPDNFHRIHNSFIINIDKISRIQTGSSAVYLNDNKIPFSKSYKEAVDQIIEIIARKNYREL